jgi:hypothetical protein
LGIGLCRCGDSLAIGLIVDGSRFSEEDTTKLLDSFVQTLITFGKSKCDLQKIHSLEIHGKSKRGRGSFGVL